MPLQNALPLLIKGFYSNNNGSNATIRGQAGALQQWSNTLPTGRGYLAAIDVLTITKPTPDYLESNGPAPVTLQIGGVEVITNAMGSQFMPNANSGQYKALPMFVAEGQTLGFVIDNSLYSSVMGAQVLAYFENPFATQEMYEKIAYAKIKQRYQDFFVLVTNANTYANVTRFLIPNEKGNVCAIQPISWIPNTTTLADDTERIIFRASVNGNSIIEDVSILAGGPYYSRQNTYPILIPGGMYIEIAADGQYMATAQGGFVGVRVWFDDSKMG